MTKEVFLQLEAAIKCSVKTIKAYCHEQSISYLFGSLQKVEADKRVLLSKRVLNSKIGKKNEFLNSFLPKLLHISKKSTNFAPQMNALKKYV